MEEQTLNELKELQNLKETGTLDENQTRRVSELEAWSVAEKTAEEKSKELQSAIAQKEHFRTKAEEAEKFKISEGEKQKMGGVDPLEVTRLGKALSQYDETETDYIIERAKGKFNSLTPTPQQIIEASKDEMTQFAINSKREKINKEKETLAPSNRQNEKDMPQSFEAKLDKAAENKDFRTGQEEIETMLKEVGLLKTPMGRKPRKNIGTF